MEGSNTSFNQICPFALCKARFLTENELSIHLDNCNASIKNIIHIISRRCLMCRRKMPQFSLCGLVRHAILCHQQYQQKNALKSENLNPSQSNISENVNSQTNDEGITSNENINDEPINCENNINDDLVAVEEKLINTEVNYGLFQKDQSLNLIEKKEQPSSIFQPLISTLIDYKDQLNSKEEKESIVPQSLTPVSCIRKNSLSQLQKETLSEFFKTNSNPNLEEQSRFVKLGLTTNQIRNWFSRQKHLLKLQKISNNSKPDKGRPHTEKLEKVLRETHSRLAKASHEPQLISKSSDPKSENSETVLKILEDCFQRTHYPDAMERLDIARVTGFSNVNVLNWFKYKRRGIVRANNRNFNSRRKPRKKIIERKLQDTNVMMDNLIKNTHI